MLTLLQNQTTASLLQLAGSIGLILLLSVLAFRYHKRGNELVATLSGAAACFIALHALTFANPIFWHHAMATLRSDDIGGRQYAVMAQENRVRSVAPEHKAELLAVGSSQTNAIFHNVAKQRRDVDMMQLPRFGILDYWLYRDEIFARDASLLVLYLSEIDWGRAPTFSASRMAPEQGLSTLDLMRIFSEYGDPATLKEQRTFFKEHFAGGLFSEFRFAYLTRGLLDHHLGINVQRAATVSQPDSTAPTPTNDELLALAQQQLTDHNLALYEKLFERFLEAASEAGQCVLLVDGQYYKQLEAHPVLARQVQAIMIAQSEKHPHVVWLPREQLPPIATTENDWLDAFHIGVEAGARYGHAVADKAQQLLDSNPKFKHCRRQLATAGLQ